MKYTFICLLPAFLSVLTGVTVYLLEIRLWIQFFRRKKNDPPPRRILNRPSAWIIHLLALGGLACLAWGYFEEPYRLEVTSHRIPTEKLNHTSLRIVQISDLHCDKKERLESRIVQEVNRLNADLIVFTGDALNHRKALPRLRNTLREMNASIGKYAVRGNVDHRLWEGTDLFADTGFRELKLDALTFEKDGEPLGLCGLDYENGRISFQAIRHLSGDRFNVLLYHSSDLIGYIASTPVDLYLCGHTHGGQVALPFYGAMLTHSPHAKKYEAGLYIEGTVHLYVNRGIGMTSGLSPRIRFCSRPEISVFDIVPKSAILPGPEKAASCGREFGLNFFELLVICAIAVGLAMDAFAVSIVSGSVFRELHIGHGLRMALFFGGFQALMPLLGWTAGWGLAQWITPFDHWIAFGLLTGIGGKMIVEAVQIGQVGKKPPDPSKLTVLLALSIATSIDALAVGLTLSLVTEHIISAVILIGLITFAISFLGWEIGRRIGHFFETRIEIAGGLILIAVGAKILLQHLFFS